MSRVTLIRLAGARCPAEAWPKAANDGAAGNLRDVGAGAPDARAIAAVIAQLPRPR